jgi:hypothetical protein
MARSGSLAQWEQRLAAQRREDDRLARERRQREKDHERVRQQEHLESQQQAAEEQTAAVEERMKALEEVLARVLPLRPLSFDRLLAAPRTPEFDPGPLGAALAAPDWADFAPVPPTGLGCSCAAPGAVPASWRRRGPASTRLRRNTCARNPNGGRRSPWPRPSTTGR